MGCKKRPHFGAVSNTNDASSFATAKAPPINVLDNPTLENDNWRAFGVMANQPNSSLLNLDDVYKQTGIIPDNINLSQSSSSLSVSSDPNAATRSSLIGSSKEFGCQKCLEVQGCMLV